MPISVHIEQDSLMLESAWTMRLHHRQPHSRDGWQLAGLTWVPIVDGELANSYLSQADCQGSDVAALVQGIMDAGWRAGFRPTSYGVDDTNHAAVIMALQAHVDSLKRQVELQAATLNKALGK